MQSQMMALLLVADGTSLVTETVFENRFMHVDEFTHMNAQIKVDGRTAIVQRQFQTEGCEGLRYGSTGRCSLDFGGASGRWRNGNYRNLIILTGAMWISQQLLRQLGADIYRLTPQEVEQELPES